MSRPQGRRVARRPSADRSHDRRAPVVALAVFALTVGAVLAAGSSDLSTGAHPTATSRLDSSARTFTCTGELPGTRGVVGSAPGPGSISVAGRSLSGKSPDSFPVRHPVDVVADRSAAPEAFALQVSRGPGWLAAADCPEPRATWWFVGAGAGGHHSTDLTVGNPRPGTAIFDVDVLGPDGPVNAPGLHGLTLASGASRTIHLARTAAANGELAVRVRASRGLVTAAAAERWAPALIGKQTHDWVAAQPPESRSLRLVGLPGADNASLVVANPGDREAIVTLQVVSPRGTFKPSGNATLTVPPASVSDLDVSDVLDAHSAAVALTANVPVTATVRSSNGHDESYATAAGTLSGTSVTGVPPGTRSSLVLAAATSPGAAQDRPARVSLTILGPGDRRLASHRVTVAPGQAAHVDLPKGAVAVTTSVRRGEVVGSLVATAGSGAAAIPVVPPVTTQRRPGVLPGW
ncbi:MAG TPA: DUF5719 family protein [Marmoricola sp.]|nr:DUF5719 family protein [Marmoricola sp.]